MIINQNYLSVSLKNLNDIVSSSFFPVFRINKKIKCVNSSEGPKLIYDRSVLNSMSIYSNLKIFHTIMNSFFIVGSIKMINNSLEGFVHENT